MKPSEILSPILLIGLAFCLVGMFIYDRGEKSGMAKTELFYKNLTSNKVYVEGLSDMPIQIYSIIWSTK